MRSVEVSAKTREDAIKNALKQLGVERHEVEVEILDEGSGGFLGFGARDVRVRVSTEGREEMPPRGVAPHRAGGRADGGRSGEHRQRAQGPRRGEGHRGQGPRGEGRREPAQRNGNRREEAPRGGGPRGQGPRGEGPRGEGPRGEGPRNEGPRNEGRRGEGRRGEGPRNEGPRNEGPRNDGPRGERRREEPAGRREGPARVEPPRRGESRPGPSPIRRGWGRRDDLRRNDARRDEPRRDEPRRDEARREERPRRGYAGRDREEAPMREEWAPRAAAEARREVVPRTAEQQVKDAARGAEAAALLQETIKRMGLEATVACASPAEGTPTTSDDGIRLVVDSPDAAILIGRKGRTLSALEYIINRMAPMEEEDEGAPRIVVDIEAYVERRRTSLEETAQRLAQRAKETGRRIRMKPLNARERRIIHVALQDDPDIRTYSVGESLMRSVVIAPKDSADEERPRGRGDLPQRWDSRPGVGRDAAPPPDEEDSEDSALPEDEDLDEDLDEESPEEDESEAEDKP